MNSTAKTARQKKSRCRLVWLLSVGHTVGQTSYISNQIKSLHNHQCVILFIVLFSRLLDILWNVLQFDFKGDVICLQNNPRRAQLGLEHNARSRSRLLFTMSVGRQWSFMKSLSKQCKSALHMTLQAALGLFQTFLNVTFLGHLCLQCISDRRCSSLPYNSTLPHIDSTIVILSGDVTEERYIESVFFAD